MGEDHSRTLRSLKISLIGLILAFGGSAILLFILGKYEEGMDLRKMFRDETEQVAMDVARLVSRHQDMDKSEKLQSILKKKFDTGDLVRAEIVAKNGYIVACNHEREIWTQETLDELWRVLRDGQPLPVDDREEFHWAFIAPIFERGEIAGALVVKQLRDDDSGAFPVRMQIALIAGIILVIGLIIMVGWRTSRRTARVKEIEGVADEVIEGKLWRRAPVVDDDRLGTLARSFNQIIDNLERQIRESRQAYEDLSEANQKLERVSAERARLLKKIRLFNVELKEKVREATQELEETNKKLDSKVKELGTLEKFNKSIFSSVTSGIIVADVPGRVTFINPEGRRILEVPELKRKKHCSKYLPEGCQPLAEHLLATLEHGEDRSGWELELLSASSKMIQLGVSSSLLRDYSHKKTGVVAIFRDITETKRMQKQIQRQERLVALGQLAAGVAHEIRNPLGGILGFAELLKRELADQGDYDNYIDKIIEEVDILNKIVGNILDFARSQKPRPVFLDVNDVLENALELAGHKIEKNGIVVKRKLDDDIPGVRADSHQLRQVFLNILYNSCEAMDSGGEIRIVSGFRTDSREIFVEFHDNGPGFETREKEQVFNPFYTTKASGTGLGLAIAYRIIENHGGQIQVKSEPGRGSTFTVWLKEVVTNLPAL